jgi:hypothetical protein
MKKWVPIVLLVVCSVALDAWQRTVCNLGNIPIKVRFNGCGWDEYDVPPNKQNNNICSNFDTGGCCISGIGVKADGYAERNFGLDDYYALPNLQNFHSTGAGLACQRTVISVFNDPEHKTFSSLATVADDYKNGARPSY